MPFKEGCSRLLPKCQAFKKTLAFRHPYKETRTTDGRIVDCICASQSGLYLQGTKFIPGAETGCSSLSPMEMETSRAPLLLSPIGQGLTCE